MTVDLRIMARGGCYRTILKMPYGFLAPSWGRKSAQSGESCGDRLATHTHVPPPQELPWEGIIKSRKSIN